MPWQVSRAELGSGGRRRRGVAASASRAAARTVTLRDPRSESSGSPREAPSMSATARAAAFVLLCACPAPAQQQRPPESWQLANGLQQRGLFEEAARQYEAFLKQAPGHALAAEAHYRLGSCRAELRQVDGAIAALRASLQAAGAEFRLRPECRYRLGTLLEGKGEHRGAVEQFVALLGEVGQDHYLRPPAHFAAGEGLRELGDDARAAEQFAAAGAAATGEQASYRFPALYQLGFAQLRGQAYDAAGRAFGDAAAAAPDDAAKGECLYLQADARLRQGDHDGARRGFEAARRLESPFADDADYGLGWVALGRDDQKAAAAAFAGFLERHPDSELAPKARLELGRARYRLRQYPAASEALAPLLAEGAPADLAPAARELAGLCALASGAGEQAVAELQQALAAAAPADRPRLSFALGEAHANLGRWAEAFAAYAAVPQDAGAALFGDALYGACFALHQLGRHDESTARARELLALAPPHRLAAAAAFAVAENLFAQQRYEPAEAGYRELGDAPAFRDKVAWKLAWCRYLRGDRADAAARFGAIAAAAKGPFAEEALAMQALALLDAGQPDAALAAADRYRARYRDGAFLDRSERVAARVLRQRGDLAAAQARLARAAEAAAKVPGGDPAADRLEQAELAYQQGDFRAADGLFAGLQERQDAAGARALAGRAWCAFELGDDEACAKWLAAGVAHGAAGEQLAGLLELESALGHRQQRWAAAAAAARSFLQRYPAHGKAPAMRYALGVAEARGGDAAAAVRTLGALLQDGGYERRDRLAYELAWAQRAAGDEAAALASFAIVAAAGGDAELAAEAKLHLGLAALEQKDLARARGLLEQVQGAHRGRALYRLGFAEFEAAGADPQRLAAARDRFAELAALPGEVLAPEGLFLGAECDARLGDPRAACARLRELLRAAPQHERADRARLLLGECAVAAGDGEAAVAALSPWLQVAGRDPAEAARAELAMGRARLLRGEPDKAEPHLVRATGLSEGPLAAEAQFRIGEARALRGDLQGAADAFVKLPILYAHAEWVRKGLLQAGLVYLRLQQPEKARRFFRELVERHGGSEEAAAAKQQLGDG
ncbi:MAG: tetratricopeptide repeat protein [Planctomycetes bacterium]|nr:tetratricopeptide repeat protein [Planctomycetota bacterium]